MPSIPVDDYARGVVDYYAEQFFPAIDSLVRYINSNSVHAGSAHFYLGLSYIFTDQFDLGIQQYDELIRDHSDDRFWASAWDEKAWTLWYKLQKSNEGAQVYIDFVSRVPSAPEAPQYLFEAARIYERNNQLLEAASTWERLINEYPSNELSYRALFLAGIAYYRLTHFNDAMLVFQRCLVLANNVEDQAGADFWMPSWRPFIAGRWLSPVAFPVTLLVDGSNGVFISQSERVLRKSDLCHRPPGGLGGGSPRGGSADAYNI